MLCLHDFVLPVLCLCVFISRSGSGSQALLRIGALSASRRCTCPVSCCRPFWRALRRVLQRMQRVWELPCAEGKLPALPPRRRHGRGGAFPEFRPIGVCKAVKLHEIVSEERGIPSEERIRGGPFQWSYCARLSGRYASGATEAALGEAVMGWPG